MAFDGSDPAWCAAVPMGQEKAWRLRIAQFGDGYQQRMLDGINALDAKWIVAFELKPASVIADMEAYLEAAKGNPFAFRDPASGVTHRVVCDQWRVDWIVAKVASGALVSLNGTLTAEFVRFNGVSV